MSQPDIISPVNDGDRRRAPRRNLLESHMATASLGHGGSALILDLSESGLGVQSVGGLQVGSALAVRFTLPESGAVIEADGRVAWSDASGRAGVHFDALDAEVCQALKDSFVEAEPLPQAMDDAATDAVSTVRAYLAGASLELASALDYIVRQSAALTHAEGAAIALSDESGMMCRASVGAAPGVGVRLKGSSGLTGECVQTAQVVRVDDTETDPRADRLLCRRINLRSTVILPILGGHEVMGVLETLSSRARAFDNHHIAVLRGLADIVATTVRPTFEHPLQYISSILDPSADAAPGRCEVCGLQNAPTDAACACGAPLHPVVAPIAAAPAPKAKPPAAVAPPPQKVVVAAPAPAVSVTPAVSPAPQNFSVPKAVATPPVTAPRPVFTPSSFAAPAPPPTPKKAPETKPVVARATAPMAAAAAPALAPEPLAASIAPYPAAPEANSPIPAPSFATSSAAASSSGMSDVLRRPPVLAGVAVLAVAMIAGWGYFLVRGGQAVAAPAPVKTAAAAPAPAAPAPVTAQPEAKLDETAAHAATTAAPKPIAAPIKPAAPALTLRTPETEAKAAAAAAPPILPQGGRASLSLPAGSSSMPMVAVPPPVSSTLIPAKLVRRENPTYPELARRIGLQGEVRIEAVVGVNGKLKDIRIVSGPAALRSAAQQAVRDWVYTPSKLNGTAVESNVAITINFQIPRQ